MKNDFELELAVMLNRWRAANRLKELAGEEGATEQQQSERGAEHHREDDGGKISKRGIAENFLIGHDSPQTTCAMNNPTNA